MGNTSACQVSNHSKRNVRVFIAEKALEMDAFIASESDGHESTPPEDKKFKFKSDIKCIRVLASQTQEVPWEAHHFLSVFVEAVVVYRVPFTWKQRKHTWKLVHAGLMLLSLLLSVLGLCAVFDFHRSFHIPNLYSLHSWVGICTVVMFAFQWVLGLAGFLFPYPPLWIRSALKPVHIWIGKAVLILSLTSCISGINEKLFLTLNGITGEPYNSLPVEAKLANSLGILIVAFGLMVFGILSKNKWRRPETDNESVHHNSVQTLKVGLQPQQLQVEVEPTNPLS
eukprot:superscaffoldBa00005524_g20454